MTTRLGTAVGVSENLLTVAVADGCPINDSVGDTTPFSPMWLVMFVQ